MSSTKPALPNQEDNSADLAEKIPKQNSATTNDFPTFGWSAYAERINGRFAMLGFIAILIVEATTRGSFLQWSGIFP